MLGNASAATAPAVPAPLRLQAREPLCGIHCQATLRHGPWAGTWDGAGERRGCPCEKSQARAAGGEARARAGPQSRGLSAASRPAPSPPMLSMDAALQVAEEEVVESCSPSSKFEDIYRLLSEGCFPPSFCSIKRKNLKRYAQKFIIEGGCLYYVGPKKEEKREVIVDPERRRQVFLESHFTEIGNHLGQKKTVHRIQSQYYWLGIVKDVVDWIKMCETCQSAEHNKNMSRKARPIKVESPWEVLGLEIHGPFPETSRNNTHILTVTDYFTKWIEAVPLPKKDALSVAKALATIFYRFGASKNIYSSQNWDFCDEVSRHLGERWNISQTLTPADPANCPGLDNCTNELVKSSIQNVVNEKPSEWDDYLDPILFDFRTSVSSITKYSPFFLMFNRYVCLSSEVEFAKDSKEQSAAPSKADSLPPFTTAVQEQKNAVKEIVIANMAAAYKREQKSVKRKMRSLPSLAFKVEDGVFGNTTNSSLKKLKKSQFMAFQIETVMSPEQNTSGMKKTS
uniref:Gypsy retrotransposon integrase-like protein 1 n=1 Tax=Pelodiscus sinensis TaxID=13735 RepID=K7GAE2_PELSI